MRIVAIGLSHNEADVIRECVKDALSWVDAFVLYDNSTDGTDFIAREAGAVVLPGDVNEKFDEGLRQHALTYAAALNPDWIVRIDPDEFYPRGACFKGHLPKNPRDILEALDGMGYLSVRASVVQFWITLDDVRWGLMLEDDSVSVQKRRRWYSVGHTAIAAWRHSPRLSYTMGQRANVPFYPDGTNVGVNNVFSDLIQTHYSCRSLAQLVQRVEHRRAYKMSFGKYLQNLIFDEKDVPLHYWDGGPFSTVRNHEALTAWFEASMAAYKERGL